MTEIKRYTKKPVTIEAVQWTGRNISDICKFTGRDVGHLLSSGQLFIGTLEGYHRAEVGDYIIKGVKGEFYPCKPDIFALTYAPEQEPATGVMSDGYHTFADLYEQRLILSAALAKSNPHAWKSKRHEDGSVPFGGGWFIMGFDTDEGCYTYHYELKDWDLFQCKELDKGKPWDGHTSKDVRRLLSIPAADVEPKQEPATWVRYSTSMMACSRCGRHTARHRFEYCPHCGAPIRERKEE